MSRSRSGSGAEEEEEEAETFRTVRGKSPPVGGEGRGGDGGRGSGRSARKDAADTFRYLHREKSGKKRRVGVGR